MDILMTSENILIEWCQEYNMLLFDGIINISNISPRNIGVDKNHKKNVLIYYIGFVTPNSAKLM